MEHYTEFLPISRADMEARGWEQLDFVVVGGDAYVDHPSFGTAIISRLLEAEGYKVGVLAQPRYTDCEDFKRFGKPKYGFFIGGGNVDSMVSHYSVAKIPRAEDEYSPGGKGGARPDRSATVYTRLAKHPDDKDSTQKELQEEQETLLEESRSEERHVGKECRL